MTKRKDTVADESPLVAGGTPVSAVPNIDGKGDEPMTDKQAVILRELADKAGEPFDGNLTRAQAHERIEYLKTKVDG